MSSELVTSKPTQEFLGFGPKDIANFCEPEASSITRENNYSAIKTETRSKQIKSVCNYSSESGKKQTCYGDKSSKTMSNSRKSRYINSLSETNTELLKKQLGLKHMQSVVADVNEIDALFGKPYRSYM
ncbi:hypothetical protein ACJMK2_044514 [Sinanodonta woodiana]|uniref:Uncharacterized protein n=1 Tax=Sinanodonta woodiana TaxID=1069815 RepID=A0ABD3W168_SINWO